MVSINIFRSELVSPGTPGPQINLIRAEVYIAPVGTAAIRIMRTELTAPIPVTVTTAPSSAVEPYTVVSLVGGGGNPSPTVQTWTQVSGPTVTITQVANAMSFTAPGAIGSQSLIFRYTVDGATIDVTVNVLPVTNWVLVAGVPTPMQNLFIS